MWTYIETNSQEQGILIIFRFFACTITQLQMLSLIPIYLLQDKKLISVIKNEIGQVETWATTGILLTLVIHLCNFFNGIML